RIKKFPDNPVSFADGYPLLLTNSKSLEAVQMQCPSAIEMSQFRPSIVIEGHTAFEEQQWDKIQIGNVTFLHSKPCVRCVLTTRDPQTNRLHPKMEPFRTLKKLNPNEEGMPIFGINLLPLNSDIIRIGDPVKVLSYRS
ncbi:MAG TPA: MOSC domain-containing protein, partial [Pasteurellaceae bacterium]|nr:MOSC domain-containing protein [Pasteurellaceae bacterium]